MKICIIYFCVISSIGIAQYKPKLLLQYDFPRRHLIGIKLLANKPLSFTAKVGYQLPFISWGQDPNYSRVLALQGIVSSVGTEVNFKHPYVKLSLEYEFERLKGDFQNPHWLINGGRDYSITKYKDKSDIHLALLGLHFSLLSHPNFSFFTKVGVGYRISEKHIYYYGSIASNPQIPISKDHIEHSKETIYTVRFGINYCFGHDKLLKPINENLKKEVANYLINTYSTINYLFNNYQISIQARNELTARCDKFKKYNDKHFIQKDSASVYNRLIEFKEKVNNILELRTMKIGTYKIVKTRKNGTVIIKQNNKDYYLLRDNEKYKELYEQNKLEK